MEAMDKAYIAPTATVVEVRSEGIICQSPGVGGTRNGYGNAIEDLWL